MKSTNLLFFVVVCLFIIFNSMPVQASSTTTSSSVYTETTSANLGEDFFIPVYAQFSRTDIISFQFQMTYDPAKLEFISISVENTVSDGGTTFVNKVADGKINVGMIKANALTASGSIIILKFKPITFGETLTTISDFLFNVDTVQQIVNSPITIYSQFGKTMTSLNLNSVNSTICKGDEVELFTEAVFHDSQRIRFTEFERGGTFLWSNGSTHPSIKVSPNATATYSVQFVTPLKTYYDTVTVVVISTPEPTGKASLLLPPNATVSDLLVQGTSVKWYAKPSGGEALSGQQTLINNTIYYSSQTLTGCESVERFPVQVTLAHPFVLPYSGNGNDHMNIRIVEGRIDSYLLQKNDVIGVFDGDICVGRITLQNELLTVHPYQSIAVSRADAGVIPQNGYKDGNPISIKVWSSKHQRVFKTKVTFVDAQTGNPTPDKTFSAGDQVFVRLTGHVEQGISLIEGWNIISFTTKPDTLEMQTILNPLIQNKSLIKVVDEEGNTLEDYGVLGGWTSSIGQLRETEGYKVKVARDVELLIKGMPIEFPLQVPLMKGWNIISYINEKEYSTVQVFEELRSSGIVEKIMDESGLTYEDYGVFGGWTNTIGSMRAGKGYKVKVIQDCTLTLNEIYNSNQLKIGKVAPSPTISKVFSRNGFDHMNVYLVNLKTSDVLPGDIIGVYDQDLLVGTALIDQDILLSGIHGIILSRNDEESGVQNGFRVGNEIRMVLNRDGYTFPLGVKVEKGHGTHFEAGASLFVSIQKAISSDVVQNQKQLRVYPTIFDQTLYIEGANVVESTLCKIYDVSGKLVQILNSEFKGSEYIFEWNAQNQSGEVVPAGTYMIVVDDAAKSIVIKK